MLHVEREKVKISFDKPFIVLEGEGQKNTFVEWDDHDSSAESPTFTTMADNVVVKSISFRVRKQIALFIYFILLKFFFYIYFKTLMKTFFFILWSFIFFSPIHFSMNWTVMNSFMLFIYANSLLPMNLCHLLQRRSWLILLNVNDEKFFRLKF